jgi:hypothetical protein
MKIVFLLIIYCLGENSYCKEKYKKTSENYPTIIKDCNDDLKCFWNGVEESFLIFNCFRNIFIYRRYLLG